MRIGEAIIRNATRVTRAWTKHQERQIRSWGRATWQPPREKKDSLKDIAWRVMPEAWAKASGRIGMAAPRQIFYAARPLIFAALDDNKTLSSVYFTQQLLPDFLAQHPQDWDLLWDDRGHLIEPHTGTEIGLGTLSVRDYLVMCHETPTGELDIDPIETAYPTSGPRNRYRHVLLIEKEGFQQIFKHAEIEKRFDLAIMSSKGMNTTAARTLVENLPGAQFLVLHDLDKAGFSILGTLTRSTRRYQFHRQADVVDLGIRLADVQAEGLDSEPVTYPKNSEDNLRLNGATEEEIQFLIDGQQRVELNAFSSDHLIDWLERKLKAHGVKKLIPDAATLTAAYRRAVMLHHVNDGLAGLKKDAQKIAKAATIPKTLAQEITERLVKTPTLAWDDVVAELAEQASRHASRRRRSE